MGSFLLWATILLVVRSTGRDGIPAIIISKRFGITHFETEKLTVICCLKLSLRLHVGQKIMILHSDRNN